MADRIIQTADLKTIENSLQTLYNNIDVINQNVMQMDSEVRTIYDQVATLSREFHDYVALFEKKTSLQTAETRLVKIRQELEKKYGHYDEVRRVTTGILQASDLAMVRKDTINYTSEELMLNAPRYWLAPCLISLSAWINDDKELADKAVKEAIKRNDEKTSLFFALVSQRANRKNACLEWTKRYFNMQDPLHLDRKAIIMIDAFASGLLGMDTQGHVSRQIQSWLDEVSSKAGYTEQQKKQWSDAILTKRVAIPDKYPYLKQYSPTWPVLDEIMQGAYLHNEVFNYFEAIFSQEFSTASIKAKIDDILTNMICNYDDEELPLRKDERYNQLIVNYDGDVDRAKSDMAVEQTAFEQYKDFSQLLTDAAMKPEATDSSIPTQKFSIALSRDWILDSYNDIILKNRSKIPEYIEIKLTDWKGTTEDGTNEDDLINSLQTFIDDKRDKAVSEVKLTLFQNICLYAGIVLVACLLAGQMILAVLGAGAIIYHFSCKNGLEKRKNNIITQFNDQKEQSITVLRATLAEVVDYRAEFAKRDSESNKVIDFLENLSPEQYVKTIAGSRNIIK